jgi:molecular chaperone Hsp33
VAEAEVPGGELRRFLLESSPVRGHHVRLRSAWDDLRHRRAYPPTVEWLLGETAVAAVLLAATLKFTGKLTLQLKGNGHVSLLVAQCTHDFQLRGTASFDDAAATASEFSSLVGNGQLVVSIETGQAGGRYQGIVPMQANSIAGCLEDYFLQSEQLPTRLRLQCDDGGCNGLLLQKLPTPSADAEAAGKNLNLWHSLSAALDALPEAALAAATTELLPVLMQEHDCRLFGATPVVCRCSCSRERVSEVLRSIGAREAHAVLEEQGQVTITCEFCGRSWCFDAADVERVFTGQRQETEPQRTLN